MGGRRLQSGIIWKTAPRELQAYVSQGLMLRAVVVATMTTDDGNHPFPDDDPVAVYCNVLAYTTIAGMRYVAFQNVLVMQERGSLHDGKLWKPRPSTQDITGAPLDVDGGTEPGNMDGDHVLIGFVDNNLALPIILGGIPHPSSKFRATSDDGDTEIQVHHGTLFGADDEGSYIVDTRSANDGSLDAEGNPPAPPTDGKGVQQYFVPLDAHHEVTMYDVTPATPEPKVRLKADKDKYEIQFLDNNVTLRVDGASKILDLDVDGTMINVIDGKVKLDSALVELGATAIEKIILGTTYRLEEAILNPIVQTGFTGIATGFTAVGTGFTALGVAWGAAGVFGAAFATDTGTLTPVAPTVVPAAAVFTTATAAAVSACTAAALACTTAAGLATSAASAIGLFEGKAATYLSSISKTE